MKSKPHILVIDDDRLFCMAIEQMLSRKSYDVTSAYDGHIGLKHLKTHRNLFLMPLPPASPELNPTEQVWQQLRDRYFAHRSFESYEEIVDSCCHAWNDFTQQKNNLKKLCSSLGYFGVLILRNGITNYFEDMSNTFSPNGFSKGSSLQVCSSK